MAKCVKRAEKMKGEAPRRMVSIVLISIRYTEREKANEEKKHRGKLNR